MFRHAGCAKNRIGFLRDFRCNNLGFSLDGYCVFGMIKTLSNPMLLVCISLANCNQGLEKLFGVFTPVAHSYLDDVLCFPIDFTIGLAAYRLNDQNYKLTAWHIWTVVLFYALYFKWNLPQTSTAYISDIVDMLLNVLGALIFQRYINRSSPNLQTARLKNS